MLSSLRDTLTSEKPTKSYLSIFSIADRIRLSVFESNGGHCEITDSIFWELGANKELTVDMWLLDLKKYFMIYTHRALGNDIIKELLVDDSSIALLFEVETKQDSHLHLIRLIFWIHLKKVQTFITKNVNKSQLYQRAHLKNAVVAVFLLGEDFERLLIVPRSYDSIRHLRGKEPIIATGSQRTRLMRVHLPLWI